MREMLIVVRTKNVLLGEIVLPKMETGLVSGHYVLMSIEDDGCGMKPEIQKKIFDPFFTTKEVGKGTGLGLSTVYGIVRQAKGFITVNSQEGMGTQFCIYLPKSIQAVDAGLHAQGKPQTLDGQETILLVEDELMLREIVSGSLKEKGYDVIEARNGKEGLNLMRQNVNKIRLVITDVIMPEMSGRQLVKAISEFQKDIRVLYLSGYTEDILIQNEIDSERLSFMAKPFTIGDLLIRAREILDSHFT